MKTKEEIETMLEELLKEGLDLSYTNGYVDALKWVLKNE